MKNHSILSTFLVIAFAAYFLAGASIVAGAQEQQPQTQPAPQQAWSADQLNNMVAPVALYPDPLLGQILVASTYPLEVVEASQWLQQHRNLRGQALVDAARQQPWDPSIQALVAVPDALAKLDQDVRWTTDLGNAFLSQETDVMSAVQRMRERAQADGRLSSTPQQTVTTQEQSGQQVIVIQPTNPEVIYVPTYDPFYVWGSPAYGYYPPLYYPSFGFGFGMGFDLGYCFADWGGWGYWGWGPSWFNRTVFVNNSFFHHYGYRERWGGNFRGRTTWVHDPIHRMHVPYGSAQVASRFGGGSAMNRDSYRSGSGSRSGASPNMGRSDNRFAGHNLAQGYHASPQVQGRQNVPRQQYRSYSNQDRVMPQVQRYQNQVSPRNQAPQQYRSNQPAFRAPQVRQSQNFPQPRFQASQQFHSAPQMSAPRFRSGGFSRGGGGFSGGSFNRGGGGGRHR